MKCTYAHLAMSLSSSSVMPVGIPAAAVGRCTAPRKVDAAMDDRLDVADDLGEQLLALKNLGRVRGMKRPVR